MSTYGFIAQNNSGNVLISDTHKNLHFYGKATHVSTVNGDTSIYGSNPLCITYTYFINCISNPFPFFTTPPSISSDRSYGITRIYGSAGNWYIELIEAPFNETYVDSYQLVAGIWIPEIYVFCDLQNRPKIIPNDNMGMIVYGSGGPTDTAAFDSRYKPLVITGGYTATPPTNPFNNAIEAEPGVGYYDGRGLAISSHASGLSYDSIEITTSFNVKNRTAISGSTGYLDPIKVNPTNYKQKPMFCYSAVGQCEREAQFTGYVPWDERNILGIGSSGRFDSVCSYWYTYRSTLTNDGSTLYCTWAKTRRGFVGGYTRTEYASASFLGLITGAIIGAATGGIGGAIVGGLIGSATFSSGNVNYTSVNGTPPFSSDTINATVPMVVLVSDASLYD